MHFLSNVKFYPPVQLQSKISVFCEKTEILDSQPYRWNFILSAGKVCHSVYYPAGAIQKMDSIGCAGVPRLCRKSTRKCAEVHRSIRRSYLSGAPSGEGTEKLLRTDFLHIPFSGWSADDRFSDGDSPPCRLGAAQKYSVNSSFSYLSVENGFAIIPAG